MLKALRQLAANRFPRLYHASRLLSGVPYVRGIPGLTVSLEYPVHGEARWGYSVPSNPALYKILDAGRSRYAETLRSFLPLAGEFAKFARDADPARPTSPHWNNGWLPDLDGIAIYAWLALQERRLYVEVGSGNSTKFARQAVITHKRRTQIVSIDPQPRAEIDTLCDEVIRSPLEQVDLAIFDRLGDGDVLFIDSSHQSFMGNDVTVFFLEILPKLKPGVLVGVHDIFLPDDYQPAWRERYYNEQYLLGCWLLGGAKGMDLALPAHFASRDAELSKLLAPIYACEGMTGITPYGGAFWFKTTGLQ